MFRGLTISRLAAGFVIGLVLGTVGWGQELVPAPPNASDAQATAADEWTKNNPRSRMAAQERPLPKDNAHPKVAPQERENLGVPAPIWVAAHGKVQPAVREALEEQKRLMSDPKSMAEFQGDRPAGFQGTAYVDVYLRHTQKGKHSSAENRAAMKEVQGRILSKLTAAEFSLIFAFQDTTALVGYVDEAGLAKLVVDADVVAIGLDDQPRPENPARARHEPGERRGKVDVNVYNALEKATDGYVFVVVSLAPVPFGEAYDAERRKLEARAASTVTAEEFRVRSRCGALCGYVNGAGLAKLASHPDVVRVALDGPLIPVPRTNFRHPWLFWR
jgi:hypothetical protein